MTNHTVVLSLGAGIQSLALALLLDNDALPGYPKPDAAIFADTQAEPPWVYQNVKTLESLLSYPVLTTTYSNLEEDTWRTLQRQPTIKRPAQTSESIFFDIPTYIGINPPPYRPTTRRCTTTYKIEPIRRKIRQHFGWPVTVDQYLGISLDEAERIKDSHVQYITNLYPLVHSPVDQKRLPHLPPGKLETANPGQERLLLLPLPLTGRMAQHRRQRTRTIRQGLRPRRRPGPAKPAPAPALPKHPPEAPGERPPADQVQPRPPRRGMLRPLLRLNHSPTSPKHQRQGTEIAV